MWLFVCVVACVVCCLLYGVVRVGVVFAFVFVSLFFVAVVLVLIWIGVHAMTTRWICVLVWSSWFANWYAHGGPLFRCAASAAIIDSEHRSYLRR